MVKLSVHGKAAENPKKSSFLKERLSVEGEAAENPIKSSCVKER